MMLLLCMQAWRHPGVESRACLDSVLSLFVILRVVTL